MTPTAPSESTRPLAFAGGLLVLVGASASPSIPQDLLSVFLLTGVFLCGAALGPRRSGAASFAALGVLLAASYLYFLPPSAPLGGTFTAGFGPALLLGGGFAAFARAAPPGRLFAFHLALFAAAKVCELAGPAWFEGREKPLSASFAALAAFFAILAGLRARGKEGEAFAAASALSAVWALDLSLVEWTPPAAYLLLSGIAWASRLPGSPVVLGPAFLLPPWMLLFFSLLSYPLGGAALFGFLHLVGFGAWLLAASPAPERDRRERLRLLGAYAVVSLAAVLASAAEAPVPAGGAPPPLAATLRDYLFDRRFGLALLAVGGAFALQALHAGFGARWRVSLCPSFLLRAAGATPPAVRRLLFGALWGLLVWSALETTGGLR